MLLLEKTRFIWFNGKVLDWDDCFTHVLTHSLHYGSAVFEGIRAYDTGKGPAVFRLKEHVERLFNSAKIIGMEAIYNYDQIFSGVKSVVSKNELDSCYIRPLLFYGSGKMGLDTVGARIDCIIAAWPWGSYLGEDGKSKGISAIFSSYTRHFPVKDLNQAKVSGFYVNSTLAKMEALNKGFKEAIMLDLSGNIAECSGENIFLVKDNLLFTPTTNNCLEGITRNSVITIAKNEGLKVVEKIVSKEELLEADEIFLTGTAAEITPVTIVEDKKIGSGVVGQTTKKIQQKYDNIVRGKDKDYLDWLEFC